MQFPRGFAHGELLRGRRVGGLLLHLAHRLHDEFNRRDEVFKLAIEGIFLGQLARAR